jgi:hypothetical protein
MAQTRFSPDSTREGELPPWETAKVYAFKLALDAIAEHTGTPSPELLGDRVDHWIGQQVEQKGGGHPSDRAVRGAIARCSDKAWYPGKLRENLGGRPSVYSEHQKSEIARVAMDLKRKLLAPTPRRVKARLPHTCRRGDTGAMVSNDTLRRVFTSRCFDEREDDPWTWMHSPAQDYLPASMLPRRVACAGHILWMTSPNSWFNQIFIDPCSSLLPKSVERKEEMMVAAMGNMKYMSPGSARALVNYSYTDMKVFLSY